MVAKNGCLGKGALTLNAIQDLAIVKTRRLSSAEGGLSNSRTFSPMSGSPLKRQSTEPSAGQPSSRRQKLEMSLELVADDLDDATHDRLDAAVLETADEDPSTLLLATFLLATIVSTSEGLLDSRYSETPKAKTLLQDHPGLRNMLNEAWRDKKFRAIRNLRV